MSSIPIEAKTDREVLLLVAHHCSEAKEDMVEVKKDIKDVKDHLAKLNGTVGKNAQRIADLPCKGRMGCDITEPAGQRRWRVVRDNWQTLTLIAVIIGLVLVEVVPKL